MKICEKCGAEFTPKYPSMAGQRFCSRSCAAKVNNSKAKKRKKTKRCKNCNELICAGYTYCKACIGKGLHLKSGVFLKDRTIEEVIYHTGSNRYGVIRNHARTITASRPQVCYHCQYDKHVEVCHIKDIAEFPTDTKLAIVNHPDNLVLLCPNCHWEFDNELLKISGGPPQT